MYELGRVSLCVLSCHAVTGFLGKSQARTHQAAYYGLSSYYYIHYNLQLRNNIIVVPVHLPGKEKKSVETTYSSIGETTGAAVILSLIHI